MSEFNASIKRSALSALLASTLGAGMLSGCGKGGEPTSNAQQIEACPVNWPGKSTEAISDTQSAYSALTQGVSTLSSELNTSDAQDNNNTDSDGPAVYIFAVPGQLLPAAEAIFPEDNTDYGTNDLMLGNQNKVSRLGQVFCRASDAKVYFTPEAETAVQALEVAGININITSGTVSTTPTTS